MKKNITKFNKKLKRFFTIRPHLKYIYSLYVKYSKVKDNTILLESFHGQTINDSSLVMAREILRLYPGRYKVYYATANMEAHKNFIKEENLNVELVDIFTAKYQKMLATCKYIITNASLPVYFVRRKEQVYLQTWHGTPLKTLGKNMRFGIESMYNVQHNFLQASYLLEPNEFTRKAIMGDYFLEDLYTGKVIMAGYPRNQVLMQPERAKALREKLGLTDKTVYAYMPTWRGKSNHTIEINNYFAEVREIFDKLDPKMSKDQVMYVNFHPIIQGSFRFKGYKHIKPFPAGVDNYSFLSCADALITDYSSVFFDFSLTGKPIIMFMYDYEKYVHDRNLYMDIKTLPFRQIFDTDEFVDCIAEGKCLDDSYSDTEYFNTFFKYESPDNPEKILKLVLEGKESDLNILDYSHNKEREWTLYWPNMIDRESDLATFQEICEEDENSLVLFYTKWFKDGTMSPLIYDKYDKIRYVITTNTPPRTYIEQLRRKLGDTSAEARVHQNDIKRCLPNIKIKEEIVSDYGVFKDKCQIRPSDIVLTEFTLSNYGPASLDISIKDTKGLEIKEALILDDKNTIIRRRVPDQEELDQLTFRFDFREEIEKEIFPNKSFAAAGLLCVDKDGKNKLLRFTDFKRIEGFNYEDPLKNVKRRLTYDPLRYTCMLPVGFMNRRKGFIDFDPEEDVEREEQEVCMVPCLYDTGMLQFSVCNDEKLIENAGDVGELKSFSCRGSRISMKVVLHGWKRPEVKMMVLKYVSTVEDINVPMETEIKEIPGGVAIKAWIDVNRDLPFKPIYWGPCVVIDYGGKDYYLRVMSDSWLQAQRLYFTNTQANCKDGYILFPYFTNWGTFKFYYRLKSKYDTWMIRLKEIIALIAVFFAGPFLRRKNNIIISEKFTQTAQDNSYYFFMYCMNNLSEEEKKHIFYAIDKTSNDYKYIKQYDSHVLDFMSLKYMIYAMTMKACVSTDSKTHLYTWQTKPSKVFDKIRLVPELFLQHGVTALKRVDRIFGKHSSNPMEWFVATSLIEQDLVAREFDYEVENVPITGFARWDVLKDKRDPSDKFILMMPTWRIWLEDVTNERFMESDYFKNYMALITESGLLEMLKENGIRLVIYLHPKFAQYIENFKGLPKDVVECITFGEKPLNEIMMRAEMLITDYSSVCWDMMFMDKPVVFYQFDRDMYLEAHGSYIDFDTQLPGDKTLDGDQVVKYVKDYIDNGFQIKEEYRDDVNAFFMYKDDKNCQRTYDFLMDKLAQM